MINDLIHKTIGNLQFLIYQSVWLAIQPTTTPPQKKITHIHYEYFKENK